jgi:CRP-like cAMP-binding protein
MAPTQEQMQALHETINRVSPIPAGLWQAAAPLFSERLYHKDEYLLRAGEVGEWTYFVWRGVLRLFYITNDGREYVKSFGAEGDFCGSLASSLSGQPNRFHIQALEECQVVRARFADITRLFPTDIRWERLGRRLAEGYALLKEKREAELLLDTAEDRYRRFGSEYPGLEGRIAQRHIAAYLGITDVALSRIRRRMGLVNPG